MGFVLLMFGVSIAVGALLLVMLARGRLVALTWWRWLIERLGPAVYPSLWRAMHAAFPLALLALGIGAWLGLAATPGMAKLAPGPVEDIAYLAHWFMLAGSIGCVLRGLHYAGCVTLEHGATMPQQNKAKRGAKPAVKRASRKPSSKTSGKSATQLKAHRQTGTGKSASPKRQSRTRGRRTAVGS